MGIGDWISNKYDGAKAAVTSTVNSATTYVEKKVDSAVSTAKEAAHGLYDAGKATLTSVQDTVSHGVEDAQKWGAKKVEEAKGAAHDLYDRGKAGLTKVGAALNDDSNVLGNLKYANPLFYTGKATEYAGKGVKLVGEGLNKGVEFLDKHSKDIPEPLRAQAGMTAGLLGFAGGLVEGAGGIVDWAGRVQQGDKKTIEDTAHGVQKVGEGLAYIDGKSKELTGQAVEWVGQKTDSQLITKAGQGYQQVGKAEQSLAGDDTKKVLDTFGDTGKHYLAKVGEVEGQAVQWVGDKTDSRTLQNAGQTMQTNAQQIQRETNNGLVQAIDKGAAERKKEYQENGSYAITRDVTRVVAEVASVVVAPEALVGKAGTAAKAAEVTEDAVRLANTAVKATEVASDAAKVTKAAEVATDATKVVQAGTRANEAAKVGEVAKVAEAGGDVAKGAAVTQDAAKGAAVTQDAAKGAAVTQDAAKGAAVTQDAAKGATVTQDAAKGATTTADTAKAAEATKTADTAKAAEATTDAAKAPGAWQEVDLGNGIKGRTREVPDPHGGPAWKETDNGSWVKRERDVPAQDGGPAWKEVDYNGNVQRSRVRPAEDGGPAWNETHNVKDGSTFRQREVPDADGKGVWREVQSDRSSFKQRRYTEGGVNWEETVQGGNRWRYREGGMDGLAREAEAKGSQLLEIQGANGPLQVQIHGGASTEEVARIQRTLEAMPPGARESAKDIYLSENLGQVMKPNGEVASGVGGMAGDGRMVLDRAELSNDARAGRIIYHEAGHNADFGRGTVSAKPPWGNGTSVSKYGALNGAEDFAEVHRTVLQDWQRYQNMTPGQWARESEYTKKMEIVRMYGGKVPSAEEVEGANNFINRFIRGFGERADRKFEG